MSFSVIFRHRDQQLSLEPINVSFEVERYSKWIKGGCKTAQVRARGGREHIWNLAERIREPVEILHNERGEVVWWGFLAKVEIQESGLTSTVSIDTMANSVAIAHTELNVRRTTGWASNSDSAAEYGTFERLFSRREISSAAADQLRDTLLDVYKTPLVVTRFGAAGDKTDTQAVLTFRGWYEPMNRRYYSNDQGLEEYTNLGYIGLPVGKDDKAVAAMSFQISSAAGWDATEIWIKLSLRS